MNKKVLLYLGKFPACGFDIDGGSILAKQLIDTLKKICTLDVVFIRKYGETFSDIEVNRISYVDYKDAENNKFARRLKNLDSNREALKDFCKYDLVITAHVSKFFGMEIFGNEFWDKTILFPMFCTQSYRLAGEFVPDEYTVMEQKVIEKVGKIITPSKIECEDLIRDYGCSRSKIKLIHRGISSLIMRRANYEIHTPVKMVYIASIKKQKNHFAVLELLKNLNGFNLKTELHLIFTVQDKLLYKQFLEEISKKKLDSMIIFHEALSQKDLAKILYEADINISTSLWETFGRGIFEGMAAGLPTFVFEKLENVKKICGDDGGIYFAKNIFDMAQAILQLIQNREKYKNASDEAFKLASQFSADEERKALLREIFS